MTSLILQIAWRKVASLRRDARGAVIMITILVYLFLYIFCTCIFATGMAVNEKIRLQNIADAAAYSAAVAEADGLSRIAMLNRALSWTYIQMTRKQMDYIVYQWMKLTVKRYDEDKQAAIEYNKQNKGAAVWVDGRWVYIGIASSCGDHHKETPGGGRWWIGQSEDAQDVIRVGYIASQENEMLSNKSDNHEYGSFKSYEQFRAYVTALEEKDTKTGKTSIASIAEGIDTDKSMIGSLNLMLLNHCWGYLQEAVHKSALHSLQENVATKEQEDYRIILQTQNYAYPYSSSSEILGKHWWDKETNDEEKAAYSSVFSPYKNTEEDELELLSMSMNTSNLHDIFGDGIDQWFVRGEPDAALHSEATTITPSENNFWGEGIRREYKSANRVEGGGAWGKKTIYRGNRVSYSSLFDAFNSGVNIISSLISGLVTSQLITTGGLWKDCSRAFGLVENSITHFFSGDIEPSAKNFKESFMEQCKEIPDNYGLVAEYNWASMRWTCLSGIKIRRWRVRHFSGKHFKVLPKVQCNIHGYGDSYSEYYNSHTRKSYHSCAMGLNSETQTHGSENKVRGYVIQGFARIYGDDEEIFDADTYIGEMVQPVKLNEKYFQGANFVAVAKRRRNLFSQILANISAGEQKSGSLDKRSLYSLFNPKATKWSIAVSAARAAFHERKRNNPAKYRDDYQTKYEVMSSDQVNPEDSTGKPIKLSGDYKAFPYRFGCPHANSDNQIKKRLKRTWNLCETDWDAVFVPVRYVDTGYRANFDGLSTGTEDVSLALPPGNEPDAHPGLLIGQGEGGEWQPLSSSSAADDHPDKSEFPPELLWRILH